MLKPILLLGILFSLNLKAESHTSRDSFESLSTHKVYKIAGGRWRGEELNHKPDTGETYFLQRDFRIGPSQDGKRLIYVSLVPGDNYVGYFSYYDEDCLQYDEFGFVQHLCLGPSGDVSWSGPCSAGSYRTRMNRVNVNGRELLKKSGDHWNHKGVLHRKNSGIFERVKE